MLWLYLHFPHLLLDHLRRLQDENTAMAVADPQGQHILQACCQARSLGVVPGMRLKTAISLAPDLRIASLQGKDSPEMPSPAFILEQQAQWLYRFSARISLHDDDGLLTEVSSLRRLYGSISALWRLLEQELDKRGLTASLALGVTPKAARLCARAGIGERSIQESRLQQALENLPLESCEFDSKTLERLTRLGLTRMGEVFDLPQAQLAQRLNRTLLIYIQQIQGLRHDPQPYWQPPHHFCQRGDFLQEVEHAQGLLFSLQRILNDLEDDLLWRQQDTDTLQLRLHHRHEPMTCLTIKSAGPEHRAEAFMELLRIRLEQHKLAAPVHALELEVDRFISRQKPTGQDLLGQSSDPQEAWNHLMSRLQARLGERAVLRLLPKADHRPEKAWAPQPLTQRTTTPSDPAPWPCRPLWLLKSPVPLTQAPSGWFSGPERISGGWWDGERVQRDYYVAQLQTGQLAWVYREGRDCWFVHGWFG